MMKEKNKKTRLTEKEQMLYMMEICEIKEEYDENLYLLSLKTANNPLSTMLWDEIKEFNNEKVFQYVVKNKGLWKHQMDELIEITNSKEVIRDILKKGNINSEQIENCLKKLETKDVLELYENENFNETVKRHILKYHFNEYNYCALKMTDSNFLVQEIMKENELCDEQYQKIAENIHLSDETRNKAYSMNVESLHIEKPTEYMQRKNYQSVIQLLVDFYEKKEYKTEREYALLYLKKAISNNYLTEDCQLDLIEQDDKTLLRESVNIQRMIARHTQSNKVLKELLKKGDILTSISAVNNFYYKKDRREIADLLRDVANSLPFFNLDKKDIREDVCLFLNIYSEFLEDRNLFTKNVENNICEKIINIGMDKQSKLFLEDLAKENDLHITIIEMLANHKSDSVSFYGKIALELRKQQNPYVRDVINQLKRSTRYEGTMINVKEMVKNEIENGQYYENRYVKYLNDYEYMEIQNMCKKVIEKEKQDIENIKKREQTLANMNRIILKEKRINVLEAFSSGLEFTHKKERKIKESLFINKFVTNKKESLNDDEVELIEKETYFVDVECILSCYNALGENGTYIEIEKFCNNFSINEKKRFAECLKEQMSNIFLTNIVKFYSIADKVGYFYKELYESIEKDLEKEKIKIEIKEK